MKYLYTKLSGKGNIIYIFNLKMEILFGNKLYAFQISCGRTINKTLAKLT